MKLKALLVTALAALLVAVPMAFAEEVTRATYKTAVEPICKTNATANEKILKNVRSEVKAGKLKPAGAAFAKAASALKATYAQLQGVAQPPADTAKLTKWLSYVKEEGVLFAKAGKALKAGQKTKAQTYVVKLTHNANLANSQVLSFGFHYCKFEPSKFT